MRFLVHRPSLILKAPMIILGFDPSLTNFGWAVHDTEATGPGRCVERGRFQTKADMVFIDRYTYLRKCVVDLITRIKPDRCGQESPVFGELYSEGLYGLYLYTMEALKMSGADVVLFSPGQIKSHAHESIKRPKGWKMDKPDMVEAAKKDTGTKKSWNHNEADAYLAARLAGRFWSFQANLIPLSSLTPVERPMFTKVHTFIRGKKAGKTVRSGLLFREDDRYFLWSNHPNSG